MAKVVLESEFAFLLENFSKTCNEKHGLLPTHPVHLWFKVNELLLKLFVLQRWKINPIFQIKCLLFV